MRELEFLPEWYPRLRRRKRLVILQAWKTLAVIVALSLWVLLARRNVNGSQQVLSLLQSQIEQTQTEQKQLIDQLDLKKELEQKEQIVAKLGFPVEMSRLLRTLDEAMPREMSLLEITCNTEEHPFTTVSANAAQAKPPAEQLMDRRLKVRIVGVAPTDFDVANFLAALSEKSFFEQVALVRGDGKIDTGHIMREFEVTFSINLNTGL